MELLKFKDGHAIHRTQAWVIPGERREQGPRLENITVSIDIPSPQTPSLPVTDLKSWLLDNDEKPRFLAFKNASGTTDYLRATAPNVFASYVRAVLERANLPAGVGQNIHLLMPALADDDAHFRYRDILIAAVQSTYPDAEISTISEPEMVLEFFRLIKGQAHVRRGKNAFFLVIDSGAATTNFTVIISTRSGDVTEASKRRRNQNLRSISFDAPRLAGRSVDIEILRRIAPAFPDLRELRDEALFLVERSKLRVSRTRTSESIALPTGETAEINAPLLAEATKWLWKNLRPGYEQVARRLLDQLQSGAGKKTYGPMLKDRNVRDWGDVAKLFDAVFVAGGTSLLPGFDEELRQVTGLPQETAINSVGGAYPVAAAVGGLAHALRPRKDASEDGVEESEANDEQDFASSLQWNIVLDCQDRTSVASQPGRIVVVERASPLAVDGGEIEFALPRSWRRGSTARARLIPFGADFAEERFLRKGLGFRRITVKKAQGKALGSWDTQSHWLTLDSEDAVGLDKVELDVKKLAPSRSAHGAISRNSAGLVQTPKASDVVIDIGMSKTVIAWAPKERLIDPTTFDWSADEVPDSPGFSLDLKVPPLSHPGLVQDGSALLSNRQKQPNPSLDEEHNESRNLPNASVSTKESDSSETSRRESRPSNDSTALISPLGLADPVKRIKELVQAGVLQGFRIDERELALAYLALCTRRFVLIAGPPGCGKSTIVRVLAAMMGCGRGSGFVDLSVQAHWVDDRPLFGPDGALAAAFDGANRFRLVLLDEVNLTRPEYYLAQMFGALDHHGTIDSQRISPVGVIGTLNVDDFSRPPSPKVIDRAMLLVMSPRDDRSQEDVRCAWHGSDNTELISVPPPEARATPVSPGQPSSNAGEMIRSWCERAHEALAAHQTMRSDLVPSRRAVDDLIRMAALHRTLQMDEILPETIALDRGILGRFIAPISGPEAEVRPLIEAWKDLATEFPECSRRLGRLTKQADTHGFVSFWQ